MTKFDNSTRPGDQQRQFGQSVAQRDAGPTSTSTPDTVAPEQHLTEVNIEASLGEITERRTTDKFQRKPRARLGRDGKPIKQRAKKTPNPEDIARARMVEALLHTGENKIFETPADAESSKRLGTDDSMAAEFAARFIDASNERQAKQNASKDSSSQVGQGPRLGGSRSLRAKMAGLAAGTNASKS